ncbi:hypothetical protein PTTG_26688 [Puccinia triticina 1-1 BBBD Race 1]|uniref:DNA 3'-5' helicase n=1 Tax=Puccinia triticina (isolate 1-1 / race 1 (BBBD)) TaxID=630390 RepID=A0A180GS97_PUCT1|nr:hypothetical protein PTTG_26688 [Puccinia triticina 1-1 BBBD Race 1]
MANNGIPILLLSATCRPVAIDSILGSLMLKTVDISFFRGELVRPEIRILRLYMEYPLKSCEDLIRMFSKETEIKDQDLLPTLIYSGTRKATLTVINVLNRARGKKMDAYNSKSNLIRRYHACTGDEDKADCVEDFENEKFPIFSSTMALGLGQNWKRVRCVIHMGRGDPSTISQMMGRCGRDGRPGLAILFMEPIRKKGKNSVKDFERGKKQLTDDDRMDAYAVTPGCLRIVNAIDNLCGYIPVSKDDPNYHEEKACQKEFDPCKCSNCEPEAAKQIHDSAHLFKKDTFDDILSNPSHFTEGMSEYVKPKKKKHRKIKYKSRFSKPDVKKIANDLVASFELFYHGVFGPTPRSKPEKFFTAAEANAVAEAIEEIKEPKLIAKIIGGEFFDDQVDNMCLFIEKYRKTEWFEKIVYEVDKGKRQKENEKAEKLQKKKNDEEEKRRENQKKEAEKLAKRADDAQALEGFKRVRAAEAVEAEERRARGDLPATSSNPVTVQPKAKRIRLSPEDKKKKEEKIKADKAAKRAEDALALEGYKKARAAEAADRHTREGEKENQTLT